MVCSPAHHFQKKQTEPPPAEGKGSLINQKDASAEWTGSHHFIWVEADAQAFLCPSEETIWTRDKIWPPPAPPVSSPTCHRTPTLTRPSPRWPLHPPAHCTLRPQALGPCCFLSLGFSSCSCFHSIILPTTTHHTLPCDHLSEPLLARAAPPHPVTSHTISLLYFLHRCAMP